VKTISALREEFDSSRVAAGSASLPRIVALAFLLANPDSKDKSANKLSLDLVRELYDLARNPNLLTKVLWQMKQRPAMTASMAALAQALRDYK
jgi:hypothetical protein